MKKQKLKPRIRKARHIISTLYKIKEIDRKREYKAEELELLVIESKYGMQVIDELNKDDITAKELKEWGFTTAAEVLSPYLKEK